MLPSPLIPRPPHRSLERRPDPISLDGLLRQYREARYTQTASSNIPDSCFGQYTFSSQERQEARVKEQQLFHEISRFLQPGTSAILYKSFSWSGSVEVVPASVTIGYSPGNFMLVDDGTLVEVTASNGTKQQREEALAKIKGVFQPTVHVAITHEYAGYFELEARNAVGDTHISFTYPYPFDKKYNPGTSFWLIECTSIELKPTFSCQQPI